MKNKMAGSCICKNVCYEFSGDAFLMGNCYCHTCQQFTGSDHLAFVAVDANTFKVSGPIKEYTVIGSSGKPIHRTTCADCGAYVFGRPEAIPHIRSVAASSLDDQNYFKPTVNLWLSNAPNWAYIDKNLKGFPKNFEPDKK